MSTDQDVPAWSLPWGGREPRKWQAEAVPLALAAIESGKRGVVTAIMGSGKSIAQARLCALTAGRVVVTVPTVALVDQMAATIAEQCDPETVGRYFTHAKEADRRITVCCYPSLPQLVADPAFTPPDLWIADECHRTASETVTASIGAFAPKASIGFSATPFRADESEELALFDHEVYSYGAAQAMADGVVVRFDARPWTGAEKTDLDDACDAMIRGVLPEGPGLVNAKDIDNAEAYAARLTAAGIKAAAVHSRMDRTAVKATMDALKAGELACVVHVNMLSEGVDYPWLRWLCLRRPVQSRVRFCQEVGRVLRAYPGKTKAILLDPHDTLGRFSLSYEAILAGMGQDKPSNPFDDELEEAQELMRIAKEDKKQIAKLIKAWRRYLRALYFAGMGCGAIVVKVSSTSWRPSDPSESQLNYIGKGLAAMMRDTTIPIGHRKMLGEILHNARSMTRGDSSDMLSILFAFANARRERTDLWSKMLKTVAGDWRAQIDADSRSAA